MTVRPDPFPDPAVYTGHVMHLRLRPRRHQFRHRAFSLLLDLDALVETRILKVNRAGLMSFQNKDHGPRDGTPLRPWVDARLAEAGEPPATRVFLHALPRVFGYVFNPLSVYFCYGSEGRLQSLIYEVKNTYGDQVAYVRPAGPAPDGRHRQTQSKSMYVSPFIAMEETYRFTLTPPGARLAIRICQGSGCQGGEGRGDTLIAAQTGTAAPLTDRALARALVRYPAFTLAVIGWIHIHALRLWWKGLTWHPYDAAAAFRTAPTGRPR